MTFTNRLLDFEEFRKNSNSFRGYFSNGFAGYFYRQCSVFKKCMEDNPTSFGNLASELQQHDDIESSSFQLKLYDAYKMMHPYAAVNWEIFQ